MFTITLQACITNPFPKVNPHFTNFISHAEEIEICICIYASAILLQWILRFSSSCHLNLSCNVNKSK